MTPEQKAKKAARRRELRAMRSRGRPVGRPRKAVAKRLAKAAQKPPSGPVGRPKLDKRSLAQTARQERRRHYFEHDSVFSDDTGVVGYQSNAISARNSAKSEHETVSPRTPPATLSGRGIGIEKTEDGWQAYRLVNLNAGPLDPHTRRDYFGPIYTTADEAINRTRGPFTPEIAERARAIEARQLVMTSEQHERLRTLNDRASAFLGDKPRKGWTYPEPAERRLRIEAAKRELFA